MSGGGGGREDEGDIERCEMDGYQCRETEVVTDATCELDGELQIEIGQGVEVFESMGEGQPLPQYTAGGFQSAASFYTAIALATTSAAGRIDELRRRLECPGR